MSINLALSLLFGAGQLLLGAAFVYRIVAQGQWRVPKRFLLLTIAAWFVASGATELCVTGMEVTHNISGEPSLQVFSLWRARADATLAIVSVALVAALAVFLIWHGAMTRRRAV
ncbi:MAG: hypothetical protein ACRDHE_02670 [Ktedonobacterales bacterium]